MKKILIDFSGKFLKNVIDNKKSWQKITRNGFEVAQDLGGQNLIYVGSENSDKVYVSIFISGLQKTEIEPLREIAEKKETIFINNCFVKFLI